MSDRQNYLATKVIGDKFIALDNRNLLTTWSIVTGKFYHERSKPLDIKADS